MRNRERILQNILRAQSGAASLPSMDQKHAVAGDHVQKFFDMIASVGGKVVESVALTKLKENVDALYPAMTRIITTIPDLPWYSAQLSPDPHSFENVDLAILKGNFAVAENGAVWITDSLMGDRAIPFIAQHLALVVNKADIVPTLPEAYEKIDLLKYDFGVFIAGPSKTADIEQSLVLGAHGPKSLTIFLMD